MGYVAPGERGEDAPSVLELTDGVVLLRALDDPPRTFVVTDDDGGQLGHASITGRDDGGLDLDCNVLGTLRANALQLLALEAGRIDGEAALWCDGRPIDEGDDDAEPWTLRAARTTPGVIVGRVMLGLGEIIEGKPPRDRAEALAENPSNGPDLDDDPKAATIDL